jgi:hypothetical protein
MYLCSRHLLEISPRFHTDLAAITRRILLLQPLAVEEMRTPNQG